MLREGIAYASVAGFSAACAGFSAKFALSSENAGQLVQHFGHSPPSWFTGLVRVLFGLASLLFNSIMLTSTAKSLQYCTSTIQSVVFTSSVNFMFTALMGVFLLGERIGSLGIVGMVLIQLGLILISKEKKKPS